MSKLLFAILIFGMAASIFAQDKNTAAAESFIDLLAKNDFQAAHNLFDDSVKAKIGVEELGQVWNQINMQAGKFIARKKSESKKAGEAETVITLCEFENTDLNVQITFNANGKIIGFYFRPGETAKPQTSNYELPKYGSPESFTETELKIGTGEFALPAVLTMPKGKTNVPAVVLAHGSGAGDRDETAFGYKPFKDLAIGLASKGIAVLRYDKRTKVYPQSFGKNFTVNEETVNDTAEAVNLLTNMPGVNPKKVFVLGHSLSGYLVPRIAERTPKAAGFIVFAGSARPLEDIILEQNFDLISKDGKVLPEHEKDFEKVKAAVAEVKNLKPIDANSDKIILGVPASYRLDLQNYNPTKTAAAQKKPMLILQGERDFQVKMTDFHL